MREYINVYQLDDIGNDKVRFDDYLLISKNALSYKFRVGELRDFVIDGIDTTLPIYNANQLMGYGLNFTPPLSNYQLLTFDELSNSWVNRELDIDAVFRFSKFEPNKFLRLDSSNKVITSDVYVSDLVVDTPLKADHFLKVDVSGSSIEYVDVYAYIDNAIDTKSGTFIPLLNAEIDRATNEEIRIESLLNSEINRVTNEEIRIENKFDTLISTEITRIENEVSTVGNDLRTDLDNEILRATNEEIRIETLLSTAIQDEEDRAVEEERRLEELIRGAVSTVNELPNILFPVGSVIMRPVNPGFGISDGGIGVGQWEKIEGLSLIGEGSHTDTNGDSRTFTRNEEYGNFEHQLSESELPSHNHSGSTGSAGSHSHSGSTSNAGSHSHSGSTSNAGSHSHSISLNQSGDHTHSGATQSAGSHSHYSGVTVRGDGNARQNPPYGSISRGDVTWEHHKQYPASQMPLTSSSGSHSHTLSIGYGGSHTHTGSAASNGSHSHSVSISSNGSHSHSVSISSNGSHNHSVSIGNTGGNQSHNNLHPVLAVPMWIRIA